MEILFILLPVALGFVLATVFVFSWAVKGGQFDDMETPALRMLLDETATSTDAARKERR